jgi:soluble lytic murein transglycosylase
MLDAHNGDIHSTLASYNAGKSRTDRWRTWGEFREPAEFIEAIPFTETRNYVQSVLRNADFYRRLYRDGAIHAFPDPKPAVVRAPAKKKTVARKAAAKKAASKKPASKKPAAKKTRRTPARRR